MSSQSGTDERPSSPPFSLIAPSSCYNPDPPTGSYDSVKHRMKRHRRQVLFRYRIDDVMKIVRDYSPTFYVQSMPWRIMAVLHENVQTDSELTFTKKFGLFLRCYGVTGNVDWAAYAKVNMDIRNNIPGNLPLRRRFSHFFYKDAPDFGFYSLLNSEQLTDESLGFVKKGAVMVEVVVYSEKPFIFPKRQIERPFTINNFVVPDILSHLYSVEDH